MDFAKYCDKQYGNRYKTDSQVIDTISERCFDGIMGKQAEFVLDNQLMNEEDWRLFVEQFRRPVDIVDSGWISAK